MHPISVLIVDESPDFAKSLGSMIVDVVGTGKASIKYAYNLQDGLTLAVQQEFHFVFLGLNFPSNNPHEARLLFNNQSLNPLTEVVVVSFHNESGFRSLMKESGISNFLVKDEIDVDELASIFDRED
jgi:DNA-binding NarL/FixJ family response regulator